MIFFHSFVIL